MIVLANRLGNPWLVLAMLLLVVAPTASADEESGPEQVLPTDESQSPPRDDRLQTLPTGQPLELPMSGREDENRVTHRDDQILVNTLVGTEVTNRAGDEVARVDSFILEQNGEVVALVAEIGGFLGAGARQVALDWDMVDIASEQEPRLVIQGVEQEALQNAPEFSAEQQETQQQTPQDQPSQQPYMTQLEPGQIYTRALSGSEVTNEEEAEVGVISDLILGREGQVEAFIVSVDGFLGLGDKSVALEWERIELQQDPEDPHAYLARVDVSREALEAAPEFVRRGGQPLGEEDSG